MTKDAKKREVEQNPETVLTSLYKHLAHYTFSKYSDGVLHDTKLQRKNCLNKWRTQ